MPHESGLYYLQIRYYNPEIGRFINADSLVSTGQGVLGYNMFAYCNNNPVNASDPTGQSAILTMVLIGTIVGVVASFGIDAGKQLVNNGGDFSEVDWGRAANSGIVGAGLEFTKPFKIGVDLIRNNIW